MPEAESSPHLPADWHVEQLRLTVFSRDSLSESADLWKRVMEDDPQTETKQRSGPVPLFVAESPFGNGYLTLRLQGNRADWLYGINPQTGTPTPTLTVGGHDEALEEFQSFLDRYFHTEPGAAERIALGVILLLPVPTREEGYVLLDRLLPEVSLNAKGSRDFFYRINRRRSSSVTELEINRLSEWSVAQVHSQTMTLGPSPNLQTETITYLSRLGLDINTAPEYAGVLESEVQQRIMKELQEFAREIAAKGDIP